MREGVWTPFRVGRLLVFILFLQPLAYAQQMMPTVGVVRVKEGVRSNLKEYVGHLEAIQEVSLVSKVQGYLEEIRFKEGSLVKAGELLFVIEQEPFKAEVMVAEARLEQAKAEHFRASRYLARLKEVKSGGVSQLEIDKATADELKARADLKLREAELLNAKLNLGYTQIRSPISGKIGKSNFKKGDLVGPGSGVLAKVVSLNPIRVVFSVPEREISEILALKGEREALTVEVRQSNDRVSEIKGEIDFLDNQIDTKTGTIVVHGRIENPEGILLPGQYVKVFIQGPKKTLGISIPQRAVLQDQKGRYVLVVESDTVIEKRVTLGEMQREGWEVKEGLQVGDLLVVEGLQKIRPGMKVKTQEMDLN